MGKSAHRRTYKRLMYQINKSKMFELPALKVAKKIYYILEHKNPKPRYYITIYSYFLGYLKRILSSRMMDRLIKTIS